MCSVAVDGFCCQPNRRLDASIGADRMPRQHLSLALWSRKALRLAGSEHTLAEAVSDCVFVEVVASAVRCCFCEVRIVSSNSVKQRKMTHQCLEDKICPTICPAGQILSKSLNFDKNDKKRLLFEILSIIMYAMNRFYEPFETRHEQRMVPDKRHTMVPYMVPFRIPHLIAEESCPQFSEETQEWMDKAHQRLPVASAHGGYGGFVEGLLLRTEALNSSHIEDNPTGFRQLCLTFAGAHSKEWNREAVNNLWVLVEILETAAETPIAKSVLLQDHLRLLPNKDFAGEFRTSGLSRIGDNIRESPYICPPHPEVESLMSDWVAFISRQDIPLIPKIALAHAQFESIHPFADGNGRTGRAVIQRMLLLGGYRTLPVSVGLYALRDQYLASLKAYRGGDPEPIVRIIAISLLAAATAVSRHIPEIRDQIENWKNRTGATGQQQKNTASALEWIAGTPAFTVDKLAEGISVSLRTAQRIATSLLEEEILSQTKRTHPQQDTKRTLPIYEAREVTGLVERVEATAKECAVSWLGGTSPPNGNVLGISERKENTAARVTELGSHPILCWSTQSGYDLGISLLELFVFQHGRLAMRTKLKETSIVGIGGWDEISIYVGSYSQMTIDVSQDENNDVQKFAALVSGDPSFSSGRIWAFWQNLRSDYEYLLACWGAWESIGGYKKYPGPRLLELGSKPDYAVLIGQCADIAFHTQLASFLEKPLKRTRKGSWQNDYLDLRGDQLYLGHSPSLLGVVETLMAVGSEQLLPMYDAAETFNDDQQAALASILADIRKYKPSGLLGKVAKQTNTANDGNKQGQIAAVKSITEQPESDYPNEELICDYLNIARHPRAHNRTMLDAEKWFLVHADQIAQKRGMNSIREAAIDWIFSVIQRLETEVLGLSKEETAAWGQAAYENALKSTREIGMSIRRNEDAKSLITAYESTELFRQKIMNSPRLHRCEPRVGFHLSSLDEREGQIVPDRCGECGGFLRVLYLSSDLEISVSSETGESLPVGTPQSCIVSEGEFGITEIRLFYETKEETLQAIETVYKEQQNMRIVVQYGGIAVWNEICEHQQLAGVDSLLLKSKETFTLNPYS